MTERSQEFADPNLYLLADEELVASSRNLTRRLCRIERHAEPVIAPDRPWEGRQADGSMTSHQDPFYSNVLYSPLDRTYHCWYTVANRFAPSSYAEGFANQDSSLCYAISADGIHWEKPMLRQVPHKGSLENNMLRLYGPPGSGASAGAIHAAFHYHSPDSDERFGCSVRVGCAEPMYSGSMTVCFSSDGANWRMLYPPVMTGDGETNTLCADPLRGQYVCTARSVQFTNLCQRWKRPWKRSAAIARSRDLLHWTPLLTVMEADEHDPEDTQIYKLVVIPYGHGYLGQLLMFYTHEMVLDNQLAFSRDLMNWQRIGDRQPILARGDEGTWDSKHVSLTDTAPVLEGDTLRFFYGGKNAPHYQAGFGALGTGTLRRDGFVCYEAGEREGVLTTTPLTLTGPPQIELNVDATNGEARVELLDEDGNPLPGFSRKDCTPICGNHVRATVKFADSSRYDTWRDAALRLRFQLRNARLYAFRAA